MGVFYTGMMKCKGVCGCVSVSGCVLHRNDEMLGCVSVHVRGCVSGGGSDCPSFIFLLMFLLRNLCNGTICYS